MDKERTERMGRDDPPPRATAKPSIDIKDMKPFRIWIWRTKTLTNSGMTIKRIVKCEEDVLGPIDIGKGFSAYFVLKPGTEEAFYVEGKSGGILGQNLMEICMAVQGSKKFQLRESQKEGMKNLKNANIVTSEQFWEE